MLTADWMEAVGKVGTRRFRNARQLAPQRSCTRTNWTRRRAPVRGTRALQRGRGGGWGGAQGSRGAIRCIASRCSSRRGCGSGCRKTSRRGVTFRATRAQLTYGYGRNGTRGSVQTLSVARAPGDVKSVGRLRWSASAQGGASEFTAGTDVKLIAENGAQFVRETLRDAAWKPCNLRVWAV